MTTTELEDLESVYLAKVERILVDFVQEVFDQFPQYYDDSYDPEEYPELVGELLYATQMSHVEFLFSEIPLRISGNTWRSVEAFYFVLMPYSSGVGFRVDYSRTSSVLSTDESHYRLTEIMEDIERMRKYIKGGNKPDVDWTFK